MKQWQIQSAGNISLVEGNDLNLEEGLAKVKLTRIGISSLDIKVFNGHSEASYPIVPTRQATGVVVESCDNGAFTRGNRVLLSPYNPCGVCVNCKTGHPDACAKLITYGLTADGYLRDFITIPERLLHYLPDHVKDNDALFVDHIAVALNTLSKLEIAKGEYVAIIGASITGICMAQAAIYYQAIPILVDKDAAKLAVAQELGVYYTINSQEDNAQNKLKVFTAGKMCECVAYNFRSKQPVSIALDYAAAGGRIVVAGWDLNQASEQANLSQVLTKHLTLFGITNGHKHIPNAINMLANKTINVSPLLSHEMDFANADKAFKDADNLSYDKIIIKN